MRRFIRCICVLIAIILSNCACSESILPSISSLIKTVLPSFRYVAEREPDEVNVMDSGAVQVVFYDVGENMYDKFGVYLAESGCTYKNHVTEGTVVHIAIKKGGVEFTFNYDFENYIATVEYPADTKEEEIYTNGIREEDANIESKWQVGDTVTFGNYPQTVAGTDKTPIEWKVLACDADKALLISKHALDTVPYNKDLTNDYCNWEVCPLRKWLNNDFFNKAFSAEEQKSIVERTVTADTNPRYDLASYGIDIEKDTRDRVFLLSVKEVEEYFEDNNSRMCIPTDFAIKNGAYTSSIYNVDGRGCCWWWLRTLGYTPYRATNINADGSIGMDGNMMNFIDRGVRPCVWVRLF